MKIAIASGKGGTGKTTVATSLAWVAAQGGKVRLLDCDVEEPNCHIFLQPKIQAVASVGLPVPQVDMKRCTGCGQCGAICEYHAIVALKSKPLVFAELCHGCGGCMMVCPEGAITEVDREVGTVEAGQAGKIGFVHGRLRIGEAMSPSLIRAVKQTAPGEPSFTIIDVPPGTSCPVIEAVKGSDFVVLVTEPTPFGLNDLRLAVEMVRELDIPFGIVVNRAGLGDREVYNYCQQEDIEILLELPDDRRIAETYSAGNLISVEIPDVRVRFEKLWERIEEQVHRTMLKST